LVEEEKTAELLQDVSIEIAEKEWDGLSHEVQAEMFELFWVRCKMHKDLHGVKGRNVTIMRWWIEMGMPGPMLLANKDNAAAINTISDEDTEELI
jgi:hypothetical protein